MMKPLISVVIPTYNREAMLPAAIRSVLAQTHNDFEIVVVDDGSTDRTAEVVEAMMRKQRDDGHPGPRIRYVFQRNMGPSAARNAGIEMARGDWIAFLDSDDTWLPEKLDWQARAVAGCGDGFGACFSDARLVDSSGLDVSAFARAGLEFAEPISTFPGATRRLARNFGGIWVQTLLARTDLIKRINGFDITLRFAEDHDFLFRLSLITGFAYVNRVLATIDRTSRNFDPTAQPRVWDKLDVRLGGEQQRLEKWLDLEGCYPPDVRTTLLRNLRSVHSSWANWHLENNQFAKARHAAATALSYNVTASLAVKWALIRAVPRLAKRLAPAPSG
jgi:glycosyltransferase involved in cell wall biosynthesis